MKMCASAWFTVILSMGVLSAHADFYAVKEKFCDEKPTLVRSGERVLIDLDHGVLGIGFTEGSCRVVDFNSVAIQEVRGDETTVAVVSAVGRRSSCTGGISPYQGPVYEVATLSPGILTLGHVAGECSQIRYTF